MCIKLMGNTLSMESSAYELAFVDVAEGFFALFVVATLKFVEILRVSRLFSACYGPPVLHQEDNHQEMWICRAPKNFSQKLFEIFACTRNLQSGAIVFFFCTLESPIMKSRTGWNYYS